MIRRFAFTIVTLFTTALVGCDAQSDPSTEGYWNGCRAGRADPGGTLASSAAANDSRYSTDAAYRAAWDDGYKNCFNQKFLQGHGGH
ncbi:MAG TPA: hypothetical protein VEJ16_05165 [Alphaproteobacteria bacterium]|nr:hypothetical protein [Alphaproteobacteria bacterium]